MKHTVPYSSAQRQAAADWFMVVREENDPDPETLQAWLRWMEADEGNRLAFAALLATWHAAPASLMESMPTADEQLEDKYDGEVSVREWLSSRSGAGHAAPSKRPRAWGWSKRRTRWAWAAVAAASVAALSLYSLPRYRASESGSSVELITQVGEQRGAILSDGSPVWLGARSRLVVTYTGRQRDVKLEAGEAFFSVRKDSARPFIVHTQAADITAVGTAFNVRAAADRVTVSVTEGVVRVSSESESAGDQSVDVRIAAGEQMIMDPRQHGRAYVVRQVSNSEDRSRWREGELVYSDEPLREVIADVARYSQRRLEIADEAIGDLHFTGVIHHDSIDEWLAALPESFPVRLVPDRDRLRIEAR